MKERSARGSLPERKVEASLPTRERPGIAERGQAAVERIADE
jgi:hypothetical protein